MCFAAPRCADLTELIQVQMLFGAKYGKEFVSAATELMPNCGVNRQVHRIACLCLIRRKALQQSMDYIFLFKIRLQLIELLSVRAPSPEKKLKLLKEIAEEHDLDWNPAETEAEFNKSPEDLLASVVSFCLHL